MLAVLFQVGVTDENVPNEYAKKNHIAPHILITGESGRGFSTSLSGFSSFLTLAAVVFGFVGRLARLPDLNSLPNGYP